MNKKDITIIVIGFIVIAGAIFFLSRLKNPRIVSEEELRWYSQRLKVTSQKYSDFKLLLAKETILSEVKTTSAKLREYALQYKPTYVYHDDEIFWFPVWTDRTHLTVYFSDEIKPPPLYQ